MKKSKIKNFFANQKGFTLVELLVVITIIGILATIVTVSLGGARSRARDTKRIADLKQLEVALELYTDANRGVYPTALSQLVPTYLTVVPSDPSPGRIGTCANYCYAFDPATNPTRWHVGTLLENGHPVLGADADFNSRTWTGGGGDRVDASDLGAGSPGIYDLVRR